MCFSASASFTASGILGAIGLLSLYKIKNKSKRALPLIFIQFLLSLQQGLEGITWLTYKNPSLLWLKQITGYGFIAIAVGIWPMWIPFSAWMLEKRAFRRNLNLFIQVLGFLVAIVGIYYLIQVGPGLRIKCNHVAYFFFERYWFTNFSYRVWIALIVYILCVIAPFFISSAKGMKIIGTSIGVGLFFALVFYKYAASSVWCFFAALSCVFIYRVITKLPDNKGFS